MAQWVECRLRVEPPDGAPHRDPRWTWSLPEILALPLPLLLPPKQRKALKKEVVSILMILTHTDMVATTPWGGMMPMA